MLGFSAEPAEGELGGYERTARKQVAAISLSAMLSIVLHAFFMINFPDLEFEVIKSMTLPEMRVPVALMDVYEESPVKDSASENGEGADSSPSAFEHNSEQVENFMKSLNDILISPKALPTAPLRGESHGLADPSASPEAGDWYPRQEIVQIEQRVVADHASVAPRLTVPEEIRVPDAPDIAMPSDRMFAAASILDSSAVTTAMLPPPARIDNIIPGGMLPGAKPVIIPTEPLDAQMEEIVEEAPDEVTDVKALDNFLKLRVFSYEPKKFFQRKESYFRIEIERSGKEVLPVLPKDVVIMQDCSASMTEQRLAFCRNGWTNSVGFLGPKDRFNVMSFRDKGSSLFADWQPVTPASVTQAKNYIMRMKSEGATDIFASLQDLLKVKSPTERPLLVVLVTDGRPTAGVMDSASIIEQFSSANKGRASVFTMGTTKAANTYLLDLLSFRNKGDSYVVQRGRWDIPDAISSRMQETSRPVLTDLKMFFSASSKAEVYPGTLGNLYLDRKLVLVGRYERGTPRLIFQVIGQAGGRPCDMAFELDMSRAEKGDADLREDWGWQKVYHLIGRHSATRDPDILKEIRSVSREYDIPVPYSGALR